MAQANAEVLARVMAKPGAREFSNAVKELAGLGRKAGFELRNMEPEKLVEVLGAFKKEKVPTEFFKKTNLMEFGALIDKALQEAECGDKRAFNFVFKLAGEHFIRQRD